MVLRNRLIPIIFPNAIVSARDLPTSEMLYCRLAATEMASSIAVACPVQYYTQVDITLTWSKKQATVVVAT